MQDRISIRQSGDNLSSEVTPLIRDKAASTKLFLKRLRILIPDIVAFDRFIIALNALAGPSAGVTPIEAFPALYPTANRVSTLVGLPFVAGQLGLSIAAEREWGKAESVKHITSALITSTNDFSFGLKFYIAAYLAADQVLNNIGDKKVFVSNAQYFTQFVLVTALFSTIHAALEISKAKWQYTNTLLARLAKCSKQILDAINKAANSNEFLLLTLSALGMTEVGNINPYDRLGIFGEVLMVGTILQVLANYGPLWEQNITRLVNTASAVSYVSSIFSKPNNQEFSTKELAFIATFFGAILLLSTISSKIWPPIEKNTLLQPINESQTTIRSTP